MTKRSKAKEVWAWEVCQCLEHGRFVREGRADFTVECGSKTMALIMLDAIKDCMEEALVDELYTRVMRTPLPEEDTGIPAELRGLLEPWNRANNEALKANTPILDPADFHALAGRLVTSSEKTKH